MWSELKEKSNYLSLTASKIMCTTTINNWSASIIKYIKDIECIGGSKKSKWVGIKKLKEHRVSKNQYWKIT